jgi:F-type H+-transporting ATPase subunit b
MIDFHQLLHLIIPVAHAAEDAAASGGIAGTFGVDWMKFVAQLINVTVVLLILWKFAFAPVTKKLQERTDKIEKAMNDAGRIAKEKQAFEAWRQTEMSKARTEASSIVTSAQTEAGKAKQVILDQTKQDQQKLIDQAKAQIESEKNRSISEAKGELADLVTNAAEKILRHKLDKHTDQELIKDSLKNLS